MDLSRTPIWTPYNCGICRAPGCRIACDAKICEFHRPILVGKNVGALYVSMYDTLVMQIDESFEHLGYVNSNQTFREFAKPFGDVMQRTILAKSREIIKIG